MEDTFIIHPKFTPDEGVPFVLSVERPMIRGKIIVHLSCDSVFQKDIALLWYRLTVSDQDLPALGDDFRPLFGWCMGAQHGIKKADYSVADATTHAMLLKAFSLTPEEYSRGFLTIEYRSNRKSKTYWIPIGLQPIGEANQAPEPSRL
jgi:hypothetical protein